MAVMIPVGLAPYGAPLVSWVTLGVAAKAWVDEKTPGTGSFQHFQNLGQVPQRWHHSTKAVQGMRGPESPAKKFPSSVATLVGVLEIEALETIVLEEAAQEVVDFGDYVQEKPALEEPE